MTGKERVVYHLNKLPYPYNRLAILRFHQNPNERRRGNFSEVTDTFYALHFGFRYENTLEGIRFWVNCRNRADWTSLAAEYSAEYYPHLRIESVKDIKNNEALINSLIPS